MTPSTTDDKFTILLTWLRGFGIEPDHEKLKRQVVCISRWQANNCQGTIEAVTGFGKTWVALFAIYLIQRVNPGFTFNIVVPSTKLFQDWNGHLEHFNLANCKVFIVNSYTKREFWDALHKCDGLIGDEGHTYLGEDSVYFSKVLTITFRKVTLLMSATLDEREKAKLRDLKIPVVDTVSMLEAKRMNYVSQYITYNYGINLPPDDQEIYDEINDRHNKHYARFQHYPYRDWNYQLATACACAVINKKTKQENRLKVGEEWKTVREWRTWFAEQQGWTEQDGKDHEWSPQAIAMYATLWNQAMQERKEMLNKHETKVKVAVDIIKHLKLRTITFSENVDIANLLVEKLHPIARAYHSDIKTELKEIEMIKEYRTKPPAIKFIEKNGGNLVAGEDGGWEVHYKKIIKQGEKVLKRLILKDYEENKYNVLCTAKALDQGFNVEGIECAVILSATSKQRQYIQRQGRAIRFVIGKIAIIINLYFIGTKDADWLGNRQKGETGIRWITSIEQIQLI